VVENQHPESLKTVEADSSDSAFTMPSGQSIKSPYELKVITSLDEMAENKIGPVPRAEKNESADVNDGVIDREVSRADKILSDKDALILPSKKLKRIRDARRGSDRGKGFASDSGTRSGNVY